jgi:hypothetical protein
LKRLEDICFTESDSTANRFSEFVEFVGEIQTWRRKGIICVDKTKIDIEMTVSWNFNDVNLISRLDAFW